MSFTLHTGLSYHTENFHHLVLCLNMPQINHSGSDSGSLNQHPLLSPLEPSYLLASLGLTVPLLGMAVTETPSKGSLSLWLKWGLFFLSYMEEAQSSWYSEKVGRAAPCPGSLRHSVCHQPVGSAAGASGEFSEVPGAWLTSDQGSSSRESSP